MIGKKKNLGSRFYIAVMVASHGFILFFGKGREEKGFSLVHQQSSKVKYSSRISINSHNLNSSVVLARTTMLK